MYRLPLSSTTDTRTACAALTLGIPVTTHKKIHEGTGERITAFCLGDRSLLSNLTIETAVLMRSYHSGRLEKTDPQHPFLDALRALENRRRLMKWIKEQTHCGLSISADTKCRRTVYIIAAPGVPPKGLVGAPFKTPDIAIASALGILGIPVIRIEGDARHALFVIATRGFPLHGVPGLVTQQLVTDFESGAMHHDTPDHPFLWAHTAVQNFRRLKDHLHREHPMIYFEDAAGSGRAALIRSDAKPAAFDHAARLFKKPRWGR